MDTSSFCIRNGGIEFYAAIFVFFAWYVRPKPHISLYGTKNPAMACIFSSFRAIAAIFLMSKAMAKKAKSILTLSFPKWRKRLYCMLYFICPKTASGSIGRFDLCISPFSDVRRSLALRLYSIS